MEQPTDTEIVHRELDTDGENPGVQIATIVAELEGTEPTDVADMYGCVDGVLDHLFSNPPSPDAQMEITYSYEGYRVTVRQDGTVELVRPT